ncbi:MAG: hypothetical protein IT285_07060, partial [Bdellovibrionales bacterium]|nr:hypothetical protein [Bdellovibrionales bacterium]
MYVLKLALRPWRVAPLAQGLTVAAVAVLVFLLGFLVWVDQGLAPALERMSTESVATAYLAPGVAPGEEAGVAAEIRSAVGAEPEVRLVDRMEFVGGLKGEHPELADQLLELGTEMQAVVPRYVTISGQLSDDALGRLRAIAGVASVQRSEGRLGHLLSAFRAVHWLSRILAAALFLSVLAALAQ